MGQFGIQDRPAFVLVTHFVRKGDGQGRVNLEVAREALRRGLRIDLVASEVAPELENHPLVRWFPVRVKGVPTHLAREIAFSMRSGRLLGRMAGSPILSNGCITSVPADVNACHFVHSAWLKSPVHTSRLVSGIRGRYQKLYSILNSRWEKDAYRKAGKVVAVSDQVRRELLDIGIGADRIQVVANGVDTEEFVPGASERERFGLPTAVPLALFAGDIRSPRKNLDTVIGAVARTEGIHLAVAGGLDGSPYPELARRLGCEDRVHFLGMVREMPALMRSCDVFAFPSRYEACSLVMLEAMASGLPVLTSRTTGGSELVPPEGGFLLDYPDDLEGMTDRLRVAFSDRADLERRSRVSRARALELGWSTMAGRYLDLLGVSR
ncbi:MAG TPA: glycosyltransferase family 4 protein [Fibrobacteria bacterium]|nr:glycosyltransferase family 4 protein [Fibrobacteria bacterium]